MGEVLRYRQVWYFCNQAAIPRLIDDLHGDPDFFYSIDYAPERQQYKLEVWAKLPEEKNARIARAS